MFTAYYAQNAIAPKIMKELGYGNIGFVNIAIIYLTFCFGSLFASTINRKLGHKATLFLASLMYVIWAWAFLLPVYKHENKEEVGDPNSGIFSDLSIKCITLITAVLVGLGSGPLWITQGCYISECASHLNKGRFNVIFFGFYQLSSIIAPFISSLLIVYLSKTTFYLVMGLIGLVGALSF